MLDILLRSEKVSEIESIDALIKLSFKSNHQANRVKALRDSGALLFSIVAIDKPTNQLVGHMALSLASLEGIDRAWQVLCLAPIAVSPKVQRQGIGTSLVEYWFREYAEGFYNAVVVVDEAEYFQRFGFERAFNYDIYSNSKNTEDMLLIKEIKEGFLKKVSGEVVFNEVVLDVV
jgi:putative acetyltransferase